MNLVGDAVVSGFDEDAWRRALLAEFDEVNLNFFEIIYMLFRDYPNAEIDELYGIARRVVVGLLQDGFLKIVEVEWEEKKSGELALVREEELEAAAALKKVDDPWVWDRANAYCSGYFQLAITAEGERFRDANFTT